MIERIGPAELFAGQPLRPDQHEIECCEQTPVTDGSFFVDHSGKAPTDEQTGMPLPISPADLSVLPPDQTNEHHHFFPRLSPVLRNSLGGKALRVSRIQRVAITQHNFGEKPFHKYFQEGPNIPSDPETQLGMCVLACAGYLPPKVVDTSEGQPTVRTMKEWEYNRLTRPNNYIEPLPYQVKRFRDRRFPNLSLRAAKDELVSSRKRQAELTYENLIYGFDPMKTFMLSQVVAQDFSEVDSSIKHNFLESNDIEAGLCLLAIGSVLAAETAKINGEKLNEVYRDIYHDGRLHPMMPPNASTIIKHKLGHIPHRVEMLAYLRSELMRRREQSVA
jgi:hypothetical protein